MAFPIMFFRLTDPFSGFDFSFSSTSLIFYGSPLMIIFALYGSFFFFTIDKRDYITLNGSWLYHKKRYFFPPVKISLAMAEDYRITDTKLVLFLEQNKEEEINLQFLKVRDAERLENAVKGLLEAKKTAP
ncbi:hypothetical protein GKZ89_12075 [Bacillus mangrovi]|uniref:DUF304 domain-containing protein n=1 Tax=Metabacillus mangrovi TaxID=1491830 RepID=A0A7X2S7B2_9BACI|nr:hypothetical protein [Metabacillus mangrovi]MTH54141.1 hypothetical protein [Metabacillus mangrovi]